MSAIDPEKRAIVEELNRRRSQLSPDKLAILDELSTRLGMAAPSEAPPLPGRPTPPGLQEPTTNPKEQQMASLLIGNPAGFNEKAAGILKTVANNVLPDKYQFEMTPENQTGQDIMTAATMLPLVGAMKEMYSGRPNPQRAGANWDTVDAAAKDVPVNLSAADDIALEALKRGGRGAKTIGEGGSLPKMFSDYIRQREASPTMTYETSRGFAKTAGNKLSQLEEQGTDARMKKLIGDFAEALSKANREAAGKVGMGDLYDAASLEYKQAMNRQNRGKLAKEVATKAAIGAGLGSTGLLGYKVLKDLWGQ